MANFVQIYQNLLFHDFPSKKVLERTKLTAKQIKLSNVAVKFRDLILKYAKIDVFANFRQKRAYLYAKIGVKHCCPKISPHSSQYLVSQKSIFQSCFLEKALVEHKKL